MDAITSVWLLKRFFPGWDQAEVKFVPAGERLESAKFKVQGSKFGGVIEVVDDDEIIHVDTGLGPLDHHQTKDLNVSAASLTWDFVREKGDTFRIKDSDRVRDKAEAIGRIVKIVVDTDHFKEVFWEDPQALYHDFSMLALLDGIKFAKPNQDEYYVTFGMECLDYLLHYFENRIWAEKELKNGVEFRIGRGIIKGPPTLKASARQGIGFETINDSVLKLAQKMGYVLAVRKDPRKGYVRIKARPCDKECSIDLTGSYKKLKKLDPKATWFLHVSGHMLLNGTPKNPKMKATTLSLEEIIKVLERI